MSNSNASQRHRRKLLLANMLEAMKGEPELRILAIFILREKISLRTAQEYLKEIKLAPIIEGEIRL